MLKRIALRQRSILFCVLVLQWASPSLLLAQQSDSQGLATAQAEEVARPQADAGPDNASIPVDAVPTTENAADVAADPFADDEEIEDIEETDVAVVSDNPFVASESWTGEGFPRLERSVNVLLPVTQRRNTLMLTIDHRTYQSVLVKPLDTALGYDAGNLKVMIGLRYAVLDGLDLGLAFANSTLEPWRTYELDARWQFLRREKHFVDVAVRAGFSLFHLESADDASGGFGQLMLGSLLFQRLYLSLGVLGHSSSSSEYKTQQDKVWTVALPLSADLRIASFLALSGEVIVPVAGYSTRDISNLNTTVQGPGMPMMSAALKLITSRHTFAFVVANNQNMTSDAMITGSVAAKTFVQADQYDPNIVIGFRITRSVDFGDFF